MSRKSLSLTPSLLTVFSIKIEKGKKKCMKSSLVNVTMAEERCGNGKREEKEKFLPLSIFYGSFVCFSRFFRRQV